MATPPLIPIGLYFQSASWTEVHITIRYKWKMEPETIFILYIYMYAKKQETGSCASWVSTLSTSFNVIIMWVLIRARK